MAQERDPGTEAFYRLLSDGYAGGQAKVDALVALGQRTVFVATWVPGGDDWRTLRNSDNEGALPIFTSREELMSAATRFGWLGPDGKVPSVEVGARAAFRYILENELSFIVIDIAAEHSLEAEREEIRPLLDVPERRDSQGPFAAVGRISEQMLAVSKGTPPPGSLEAVKVPAATTAPRKSDRPGAAKVAFVSNADTNDVDWTIVALQKAPTDDFLDDLDAVLREYPEVEWASLCLLERADTDLSPATMLKVSEEFMDRVDEIKAKLITKSADYSVAMEVMLISEKEHLQAARNVGKVFFPWKR